MADKIKESEQKTTETPLNSKKELKEILTPIKTIINEIKEEIKCALIEGRVNYII